METMDDDLYRDTLDFAHDTPSWFQHLAEVWTELGLLLFGVLFIVAWWRARRGDPRALAIAVLAPLATAVAYVCSEALKSVIDEERPCRAVSGAMKPLVECPAYGDWSFPSNHSTIAGAAAIGLVLAWPRIAALTVPMAVLMAASRVFVGVHYPHDVAVGLVFGAVVTYAVVRLTTRPVARVAQSMRGSSTSVVQWFAGPGPALAPSPAADPAAYDNPTMTFRRHEARGQEPYGHGRPGQQSRPDRSAYGRAPQQRGRHGQDPRAQDSYGQDPQAHGPYGQDPRNQDPRNQDPRSQDPYGQDPYGQDPQAHGSHGQDPYGRGSYGYGSHGDGPHGHEPQAPGSQRR
ncbi:phosphatase PAP2 family protein [Streptomyces alfalfae]|nr:phosphatase PAP2 family protein [Streptomyces fradiae]RXX44511.1 phosphatase PAP2 family protein [Streptomyces alfalfae]RZM92303.1 phosphatase PAP2 family protein [Streptomyces alfalfae]